MKVTMKQDIVWMTDREQFWVVEIASVLRNAGLYGALDIYL